MLAFWLKVDSQVEHTYVGELLMQKLIDCINDCDKSSILSWRATTTDPICAEDRDFKRIL